MPAARDMAVEGIFCGAGLGAALMKVAALSGSKGPSRGLPQSTLFSGILLVFVLPKIAQNIYTVFPGVTEQLTLSKFVLAQW